MCKFVKLLICFALIMCIFLHSLAYDNLLGNINYWYSDVPFVYRFKSKPSVGYDWGSGFTTSKLYSYLTYAQDQWSIMEMTSTYTIFESADIKIFGGTPDEVKEFMPGFDQTGVTDPNALKLGKTLPENVPSYEGTFCHIPTSSYKECSTITKMNIAVVYSPHFNDNNYKTVLTHELGHGFGWVGHSSVSNHIMQANPGSIMTINNNEAKHLRQIKAY